MIYIATTPPILLLVRYFEKFKKLAITPNKLLSLIYLSDREHSEIKNTVMFFTSTVCRAKYPRIIPEPLDSKSYIWPSILETLKHIFSLLISLFTPPKFSKIAGNHFVSFYQSLNRFVSITFFVIF